MEKIEETTRTVKNIKHYFYCDECNKYLGSSEEYDDGYYKTFGDVGFEFHIDDWYRINRCLCDDCKNIFINNLKETLKNIGFENR